MFLKSKDLTKNLSTWGFLSMKRRNSALLSPRSIMEDSHLMGIYQRAILL
jgi:hypothetical protein